MTNPLLSKLLGAAFAIALCIQIPPASAAEFALKDGDHITLIGNTLADRMQHDGWLEAFVQARIPEKGLVFRNLGFAADEITKRPRSANFGSPEDWLKHTKTDVVLAFFGYNESFRGEEGIEGFKKEVAGLIDSTQAANYSGKGNARIVLVSPIAHEDLGNPNLPDGSENNARLALYSKAMGEVAAEKGVPFVDLFTATQKLYADSKAPLTINGIHLNSEGNKAIAPLIANVFIGAEVKAAEPVALEKIRAAVLDKNLHWWSRYRTVDGYNVFGGRSALNWHGQSNADVMKREMEIFDVMTANRDLHIQSVAKGKEIDIDDSNTPPELEVKTNRPGPLETGTYPYLGGEEAIGKMKVAEGMKINLFASEEEFPDLINPVQMAVDTDSRLWVATWPTYPHWNPKEPMADKLVILPDEDKDGRADKLIVFADKLNSVTGFEFWGGGVLVAAAPEILFLKDTDGDDKADVRIRLLQGLSSADSHHTANGLTIGPDGCLYYSRGVFHVTNMETPTRTFRSGSSGVYRFDPRTFEIDFHFPIGPNPHGNAFDSWGYQYATDGTGGTGNYIAVGKGRGMYRQFYQKRVRPVPASGILSSSHFPPENEGNFLICNAIGFLGVLQHEFRYNGSEITAEEVEPIVVSTDSNFRPSDVEVGGDGALYIADWQQALIGHMQHHIRDPNRDHKHGRIYRVTAEGRKLLDPPKMKGKPEAEVARFLKAPEKGTRYRARLELSGRDSHKATAAAAAFAADLDIGDPADAQGMLEALWVFEEHRIPNLALATSVFGAKEPKVRAAAIRTVGHWAKKAPEGLALVQKAARDPEPLVRAQAVTAAAEYAPSIEVAEVLFEVGVRPTDPNLEYVIEYAKGELNLNGIVSETLGGGGKLSDAGQRYMLRTADNANLLKMERSEAVNREILSRAGIGAEDRLSALDGLAKATGKTSARLLVDLIGEGDETLISEYAEVLTGLKGDALSGIGSELSAFAKEAKNPALRSAAMAAMINAGTPPKEVAKVGMADRKSVSAFLAAVPKIHDGAARAELYPLIRPLAFGLPENLRKDPTPVATGSGVRFEYYEEGGFPNVDTRTLDKLKPKSTGKIDTVDYNIPGRRPDVFAIRFTSYLQAPTTGKYGLFLSSDDGSRLYLDGKLVIDHDGLHGMGEKGVELDLVGGSHKVVVTYFDNGGGDGLLFSWQPPGGKKEVVPASAFAFDASGGLERAAAGALAEIPARAGEVFGDMVALLGERKHGETAIAFILGTPEENWPADKMSALGKALAGHVPETPVEIRDGKAFKDSIALGQRVAKKLSKAEADDLIKAISNLDLAVVRIKTVWEQMRYDRSEFTVKAGKPVKVVFENVDAIPHNFVITVPGAVEEIGKMGDAMATDPDGFKKKFIPDSPKVLHATGLINRDETAELSFVAPEKPGDYGVVCTFPGHWQLMRGTMRVVE